MLPSLQMAGIFNFFTFVILFTEGTLTIDTQIGICSTWNLDYDSVNSLDASVSLWERNDCSNINCALLCERDPSCMSYFHHPSLKKCLASSSYKRGLPIDKAMQQGWNYYTKPQHCDNGYIIIQSLGVCYKYYKVEKTFDDAMKTCEADGAKLMIIRNEDEFRFVQQITNGALTFIGLRAMGVNREWKWWNGQLASYFAWNKHQPDNFDGTENCVVMYTQYSDVSCSTSRYHICQKFI